MVKSGSIYHIRIRAEPTSSVSFTDDKIARALLNSTRFYHESGRWHCHLLLLMPDHLHALIAFPIDRKMSDILGAWKGFQTRRHDVHWQKNYFLIIGFTASMNSMKKRHISDRTLW